MSGMCKHGVAVEVFCMDCFAQDTSLGRGELFRELARQRLVDACKAVRLAIVDYREADPLGVSSLAILDSSAEITVTVLEPRVTTPAPPPRTSTLPPPEDK